MKQLSSKIKKGAIVLTLITTSVLVQITLASAVFIDFEAYPDGTSTSVYDPLDSQYLVWGVSSFESRDLDDNLALPVIGQYPEYPVTFHSGISGLAPHPGAPMSPDPDIDYLYGFAQAPISIYFSSSLNYFSIYAMDVGYNGLYVEAFSSDSTPIASITIDGTGRDHNGMNVTGDGFDFIEFNETNISYISFSQIYDADWDRQQGLGLEGYLLDDMTIVVVPEPAGIILFSAGGLLLGARRKWKKKN